MRTPGPHNTLHTVWATCKTSLLSFHGSRDQRSDPEIDRRWNPSSALKHVSNEVSDLFRLDGHAIWHPSSDQAIWRRWKLRFSPFLMHDTARQSNNRHSGLSRLAFGGFDLAAAASCARLIYATHATARIQRLHQTRAE